MGRHASTALGSRCHLRGPASIRAMSKHPPVNAHESTRQCGSTSPNVGRGLTGKVPCSAVRRCKRSPVNADASARQCGSTSPNVGRAVPAGPRVQPCDGASGHRSTLMRRHASAAQPVPTWVAVSPARSRVHPCDGQASAGSTLRGRAARSRHFAFSVCRAWLHQRRRSTRPWWVALTAAPRADPRRGPIDDSGRAGRSAPPGSELRG
jgi:hypothetical protein